MVGDAVVVDEDSRVLTPAPIRLVTETLLPGGPPFVGGVQASYFLTRAAWEAATGLDERWDHVMDSDLYQRCSASGIAFERIRVTLAAYRQHTKTKTIGGWRRSLAEKRRLCDEWLARVEPAARGPYRRRVREYLAGQSLASIVPTDPWSMRAVKVAFCVGFNPLGYARPSQVWRLLRTVLTHPANVPASGTPSGTYTTSAKAPSIRRK
jgi:hypothetical protein